MELEARIPIESYPAMEATVAYQRIRHAPDGFIFTGNIAWCPEDSALPNGSNVIKRLERSYGEDALYVTGRALDGLGRQMPNARAVYVREGAEPVPFYKRMVRKIGQMTTG